MQQRHWAAPRPMRRPRPLATAVLWALAAAAAATAADDATTPAPPLQPPLQPALQPALQATAEPAEPLPYALRGDVQAFAAELAERHGWPENWAEQQLAQARYNPTVARLIMPAPVATAKNWAAYHDRFIEPKRIAAGVAFWNANADALAAAEARYGVPAAVIVGIIGVETFYGRITGNFRVIDALATLAFDFPSGRSDRSAFFRGELEQLLAMCRREGLDCASVKGSYAGAMGLPQFMPGSVNEYAVDFDGNGHIDLLGSPADAIGSVAHYLAQKGWQPGQPTHFEVTPPADPASREQLLAPDIVPSFSAAEFAAHGAVLSPAGRRHAGLLALVELRNGETDAPSYVAGTQNFYVITRYNWSAYYALAVAELGLAVEAGRLAGARTGP